MNCAFSRALPAPHVPCRQSFALSLTRTARNGVSDRFLPGKTRSPRTPLARVNRTSPAGAEQQSHRHRSTGPPFPATAWKTTSWHACEDLEQRTSLPKSRLSSALLLNLGARRRSREFRGASADKEMQQRSVGKPSSCASCGVARLGEHPNVGRHDDCTTLATFPCPMDYSIRHSR